MQSAAKHPKKVKQTAPLSIDDTLKERFGQAPLFPEKIEKAIQIMAQVRENQAKQ